MEPAPSAITPVAARLGVQLVFALWALGSVGVLAGLARTACEGPAASDPSSAALAGRIRGWRVEHWLTADREQSPRLVELLSQRGPRSGVSEEIHFDRGAGEPAGVDRLTRAGWKIVDDRAPARRLSQPELRIFAPDGSLIWSGAYRSAELAGKDVQLLDDVVLARLARGESGPDHVPVGCRVSLRAEPKNFIRSLLPIR